MIQYLRKILLVLVAGIGFSACCSTDDVSEYANSNDNKKVPTQEDVLAKTDGIIGLQSGIGDWDEAYLTRYGYFCYKRETNTNASEYSSVAFLPADGSDIISLIATKSDNIPTQMVTKNGIVYFSFPNDSILELLYDDGNTVTMLNSIAYSKKELLNLIANNNGDAFKAILASSGLLMKFEPTQGGLGGPVSGYGRIFEEVSEMPYIQDGGVVDEINVSDSGNYEFVENISEWYDDEVGQNVCNTLSLWTGKATYKVGGSSCTLSGTIWCPSNVYNNYGTYGIICDEDLSKLTVGNAEYEGAGFQSNDDLSYSVDFRGFKPNTTYYYRAYYKFNSNDHGNIVPRYGNLTDQIVYDSTIKSFKTGDNALSVDVVMCIDVTGSMSAIIGTVKNNAIAFYDLFRSACQEDNIQLTGLRSQVIAFRDVNADNDGWINASPTYSLPDQKSDFDAFVNSLYAFGGGDTPESGLEALDIAFNKSDWGVDDGYHRQIVILWTDAPYLIGSYSSIVIEELKAKWNVMPSGRRLILFAPNGAFENGGDWAVFDSWKNVIHEINLSSGFNDFDYILKSIIGELTSKGKARSVEASAQRSLYFRPNN